MEAPPHELAERILSRGGRALLVGGESRERRSLAVDLLGELQRRGLSAAVASADLALPLVGPPGAVSTGRLDRGGLRRDRTEAVCTLDPARFRLPLVLALERLLREIEAEFLLVEVPRVTRGMAGAELALGLLHSVSAGTVLHIGREREGSLEAELLASGVEVIGIDPGPGHSLLATGTDRAHRRTRLWDEFLADATEIILPGHFGGMPTLGAPPPRSVENVWCGRQVALLGNSGGTVAFGEIEELGSETVRVRARRFQDQEPAALLVRDARRDLAGLLSTEHRRWEWLGQSQHDAEEQSSDLLAAGRPVKQRLFPPVMTLTTAKAFLVNGIFGDPLLHVRLRHRRRSLLFDLGEAGRLAARIAHQVSDVFVSHAHFDHFGGFLWLLRSSIGSPRLRRLYGPPGIASHVEGMMAGILWDRIGERGPVFEVREVQRGKLRRVRLRAGGQGSEPLPDLEMHDDVLLEEPEFRVRATMLDHGIPVLAFALEETRALHVRADRLRESGIAPGPWLGELKRLLLEDRSEEAVRLPDGRVRRASELAAELVFSKPGEKLVYATDFDDSEENREGLLALAAGARVFFCEASFLEQDSHLARSTHHLTARSCGRIASLAGVAKLVPFHFSKRYEDDPSRVYREVMDAFSRTVVAS